MCNFSNKEKSSTMHKKVILKRLAKESKVEDTSPLANSSLAKIVALVGGKPPLIVPSLYE